LEDARELPNILIDTQDGVLVFEGLAYFYGDGVVMVAEDLGRVFEEKLYRALTDEMGFEVFRRALNLTTTPPWLVEPPRKWGLLTSNRRSASN
jgi:hypothetical protein